MDLSLLAMKPPSNFVKAPLPPQRSRNSLVKPSAAKALDGRRGFAEIKHHAQSISDKSMSAEVVDIRQARGFAPIDLSYQVIAWPKL